MSNIKKLSIIIVNYNTTSYTLNLVRSINKYLSIPLNNIIIIDNNSDDGDILRLEQHGYQLIQNEKNLGFATAVNQGLKTAKTPFVLLLNPDSVLIDSSVQKMFDRISTDTSIGIIGGKILDKDGGNSNYTPNIFKLNIYLALFEFTILKRFFSKNSITRNFKFQSNKECDVNALCGAFMMFRRKINNKKIFFDENYFMYLEDLDFSIQINKLGLRNVFFPLSSIKHIGGASSMSKYRILHKHWYKSRKYFFNKYLSNFSNRILGIIFFIETTILALFSNEP